MHYNTFAFMYLHKPYGDLNRNLSITFSLFLYPFLSLSQSCWSGGVEMWAASDLHAGGSELLAGLNWSITDSTLVISNWFMIRTSCPELNLQHYDQNKQTVAKIPSAQVWRLKNWGRVRLHLYSTISVLSFLYSCITTPCSSEFPTIICIQ